MITSSPSPAWEDAPLVAACLAGDERGWEALLQKYKRLIYSVIVKYRLSEDDAADVFQAVCLDMYTQLDQLREVKALRGWLMRITANKCYHSKRRQAAKKEDELEEAAGEAFQVLPEWAAELERAQVVREAMARISPRCQELVRLLFFEEPPRPYDEIAGQLGLALGSIGFIRGRCLKKMLQALEELGL